MVIYRPDRKSSECKEEEEDDDDNRDGDVALNHVGWRRPADRGREVSDSVRCVGSFDYCRADMRIGEIKTRRGGQSGRPCTGWQQCVGLDLYTRKYTASSGCGSFRNTQLSFFQGKWEYRSQECEKEEIKKIGSAGM